MDPPWLKLEQATILAIIVTIPGPQLGSECHAKFMGWQLVCGHLIKLLLLFILFIVIIIIRNTVWTAKAQDKLES